MQLHSILCGNESTNTGDPGDILGTDEDLLENEWTVIFFL